MQLRKLKKVPACVGCSFIGNFWEHVRNIMSWAINGQNNDYVIYHGSQSTTKLQRGTNAWRAHRMDAIKCVGRFQNQADGAPVAEGKLWHQGFDSHSKSKHSSEVVKGSKS